MCLFKNLSRVENYLISFYLPDYAMCVFMYCNTTIFKVKYTCSFQYQELSLMFSERFKEFYFYWCEKYSYFWHNLLSKLKLLSSSFIFSPIINFFRVREVKYFLWVCRRYCVVRHYFRTFTHIDCIIHEYSSIL